MISQTSRCSLQLVGLRAHLQTFKTHERVSLFAAFVAELWAATSSRGKASASCIYISSAIPSNTGSRTTLQASPALQHFADSSCCVACDENLSRGRTLLSNVDRRGVGTDRSDRKDFICSLKSARYTTSYGGHPLDTLYPDGSGWPSFTGASAFAVLLPVPELQSKQYLRPSKEFERKYISRVGCNCIYPALQNFTPQLNHIDSVPVPCNWNRLTVCRHARRWHGPPALLSVWQC